MKKLIPLVLFLLLILLGQFKAHAQMGENMKHLASYTTQTEGVAEVVAYDKVSQNVYFTSSENNNFSILDISNPENPLLVKEIDLSIYGGGPNSIDVRNGIVAVAIENNNKQENGWIAIFDTAGVFLDTIQVGALPDMLTFSPDGTMILVANEGEPDDDYNIDPLGSISVIDVDQWTVATYDFSAFNDQKQSLLNKGIRLFGDNGAASVAQDLEPEYITILSDNSLAYINCQENNALALFDLVNRTFVDILPLGYKDHWLGSPSIALHNLNEKITNWPALGQPVYHGGQDTVFLGGFSGMYYDSTTSSDSVSVFFTIPDRGPNDGPINTANATPTPTKNLRPFKLPDYQGRIVQFTVHHNTGEITLDQQTMLFAKDGVTPISGKGNIPGFDEVPVTYTDTATLYKDTSYVDNQGVAYHELSYDPMGGDFEGILRDRNGYFWMCDEYRPAIYKFDTAGVLIDRYVPQGSHLLGTSPVEEGTYGSETLPAVYAKRWSNRGFEAIAYDAESHTIYAFIQSPMYNRNNATQHKSDVIRILGINADTGLPISEYVYLLEGNKNQSYGTSRVDKIGDAVYKGQGKMLVIERDSEVGDNPHGKKFIFEIDLLGATNTLNLAIAQNSGESETPTLEEMSADDLYAQGIQAVKKRKVLNLPSIGYWASDKAEGLALLPNDQIAVLNDNDFGLAGAGVTDNSVLGIISFNRNYGLDPSDRDDSIQIQPQPVLGMLLPDAIASYEVDGIHYIVTVNEGDSRDYDGYSEEERVKDLTLNPMRFPNADEMQEDENLGRLKTTTANGDYDGDGTTDQIYSFGGRSFSIFDQYGNLVYDSGQDFAEIILSVEPELFNEDEGDVEGRSDDKGGEPEAIEIGQIGEKTYAFIGLERQSAIIVYEITNPFHPQYTTYYVNRDKPENTDGDIAPEIIRFIAAEDSPNGKNLLVVGYEVSGSVGIIQLDDELTGKEALLPKVAQYKVFPNPVGDRDLIQFDQVLSGKIYNIEGQFIQSFKKVQQISTADFQSGIYVIVSELGVQRFVKL